MSLREGVAKIYASDGAYVGAFNISEGLLDLSHLPTGTYLLRLSDGEVLRIVKQ